MTNDEITNIKASQKAMQKDIEHIKGSIDSIEGYIEEDRKWKEKKERGDTEWREEFGKYLENRYATKKETEEIRFILYASIGGALTAFITMAGFIINTILGI